MKRMAKRMQTQCSIIGTLAEESQVRKRGWIAYGSNIFFQKKDNQCRPLSFWTERDIWDYIELYKIPVSDLYGQGYQRNGCMFCGFGLCAERRKLCITHNFRRCIIAFPCVSQFSDPEGQRFESSRSHQKGCCTRVIPRAAAFSFYWDSARFWAAFRAIPHHSKRRCSEREMQAAKQKAPIVLCSRAAVRKPFGGNWAALP